MIPHWEAEEHYRGYRFESGVDAARRTVAEIREREHPDIVIVAAHAGWTADARENMVCQIATDVPGIDAIVFGHSHQQLASLQIGDVLLMQPKNWGISLGKWILSRTQRNIRMEDCFEDQPPDSGDARYPGRRQDTRNRPALSRTRRAIPEYAGG